MSRNDLPPIRIGTRASRLALWQAEHVAGLLRAAAPDRDVEVVHVSTIGDRDKTEPLRTLGSFGVFTREVQNALFDDRADIAVHSLKDLPTEPVDGLTLAAVPGRAAVNDVLVLPAGTEKPKSAQAALDALPDNAVIGTGSLRRQAQLLHYRSDLQPTEMRGNVETRLHKLDEGEYAAVVLAEAGLRRLELADRISAVFETDFLLPAVGQGALGIECRAGDTDLIELLGNISDPATMQAVTAERCLLATLRAGCHAPLGCLSESNDDTLKLTAVVLSQDGSERIAASAQRSDGNAAALGQDVAQRLLEQGAGKLIEDAK